MSEIFKGYLKYVLPAILILAAIGAVWWLYHHQYSTGYSDGVAAQKAAQERANNEARLANEAEKTRLEREHAAELAGARADADAAANSVSRLRGQLAQIGRITADYSGTVGISAPAGNTARVLAYVLGESVERNRVLAKYADEAAAAGRLCERQYDSLTSENREAQ